MQWPLSVAVLMICLLSGLLGPIQADEPRPKLNDAEDAREFNRLLDTGELDRAEELAREAFLQSSSNPQAVLMVRQVFLMRKLQDANRKLAETTRSNAVSRDPFTRVLPRTWAESTARRANKSQPHPEAAIEDPFARNPNSVSSSKTGSRDNSSRSVVTSALEGSRQRPKTPPVEPQSLQQELQTRVFPVADLMVPIQPLVVSSDPNDKSEHAEKIPTVAEPQFKELIDLITHTIEPNSWSVNGDVGSIVPNQPTLSLVVRQTPGVQEKIDELLSSLRTERDLQVSLEILEITAPPEMFMKVLKSLRVKSDLSGTSECPECDAGLIFDRGTDAVKTSTLKSGDDSCEVCEIAQSLVKSFQPSASETRVRQPIRARIEYSFNSSALPTVKAIHDSCRTINRAFGTRWAMLPVAVSGMSWVVTPVSTPRVLSWMCHVEKKLVPVAQPVRLSILERSRLFAAAQALDRMTVRSLPRMTMFNGQAGVVTTDGHILQVQGTVNADKNRVRLSGSLDSTKPGESDANANRESATDFTFLVHDGEAVLIPAKSGSGKSSKQTTMFLVTPRIVSVKTKVTDSRLGAVATPSLIGPASAKGESQFRDLIEKPSGVEPEQRLPFGIGVRPPNFGLAPGNTTQQRIQFGVGVPLPAGDVPSTDKRPFYFRSGGVEIRR